MDEERLILKNTIEQNIYFMLASQREATHWKLHLMQH